MQAFAIILIVQLITASIFLHLSPKSPSVQNIKHSVKHVLGISTLADDAGSTTDQPTDTPTPESSSEAPNTPDTPTEVVSPEVDTLTSSPTNEPTNISPSPEDIISDTPTPIISGVSQESDLTVVPLEARGPTAEENPPLLNASLLNPGDIIASPDSINPNIVAKAQSEDALVDNALDPSKKAELLTDFSNTTLHTISQNLKSQDFSTTSYEVQRLLSNINQVQIIMNNGSNDQQEKQKFASFCKQADFDLKTQQLQVPENLEQDIEIARGDCLITQ